MRWEGVQQFNQGFDTYERRVKQAVRLIALKWQAIFESEAKRDAPWGDVTGNARQSLHAFIEELASDTVRLYLSHGIFYFMGYTSKHVSRAAIL
jgi:hypothetical protein